VVIETDRFIVIEPYAARFPFETWILPKQHKSHYEDTDSSTSKTGLGSEIDAAQAGEVLERPPYNF